jgi:hypothetical protein
MSERYKRITLLLARHEWVSQKIKQWGPLDHTSMPDSENR